MREVKPTKGTASHIMLYVILAVYILVAIAGIVFIGMCIGANYYESGAQGLIALFSFSGVCGSSVTIAYSNKAAKENEIKIANDKYRMRLDMVKEIFNECGDFLTDESVEYLKKLMDDTVTDKVKTEVTPSTIPEVWQQPYTYNSVSGNTSGNIYGTLNICSSKEGSE